MKKDPNALLARWLKAYLVLAIIVTGFSILWIVEYSRLIAAMVLLFMCWGPLILQLIRLRATSSIYTSFVSMYFLGVGLYSIITPGYSKIYALAFILFAIFYFFGSTKTWKLHELSWLSEKREQT